MKRKGSVLDMLSEAEQKDEFHVVEEDTLLGKVAKTAVLEDKFVDVIKDPVELALYRALLL
jgi:hypothetical protein